jgi:hypothetical protein
MSHTHVGSHRVRLVIIAASIIVGFSNFVRAGDPPAQPVATPAPAQPAPGTPTPAHDHAHGGVPATPAPGAPATTQFAPGTGPQIVFDTPSYDFGKVMAGEPIRHDFWFTNRGNAILEVTAVRPGCGCTVAGDWDRKVEPGKTGKIPVMLRTEKMNSAIQKNISVTTNVPGQPEVVLWLKGNVWSPIDIQPAYVNFASITETGTPKEQIVKITNKLDEPIDLKNVKSNNPMFRVDVKPITAGKEYEMKITALPPMPTGSQVAQITADTGNAKSPQISVTATAYIPPRIEVQPAKILIPSPLTTEMERAVYVTFNAGSDLKVSDVKCTDEKLPIRLVEDAPGKRFRIVVKFPAKYEIATGAQAKITFKTSDKSMEDVTVPIESVRAATPPVAAQQPIRVPMGAANPAGTTTQPVAGPGRPVAPAVPGRPVSDGH